MKMTIKSTLRWWHSLKHTCIRKVSASNAAGVSHKKLHHPVLVKEVLDSLYLVNGGVMLDMTFGAGGHSKEILQRFKTCKLVTLDRDPHAYDLAKDLANTYRGRVLPLLGRFSDLDALLKESGVNAINGALIDCGCSSMQMDSPSRGFGLATDGPLDMRMDGTRCSGTLTAADVVNRSSCQDLSQIFEKYGEEKHAGKIARTITHYRKTCGPILTTKQLADVIETSFDKRSKRTDACGRRTHSATKCFMALRIFVNDELNELYQGLKTVENYITAGGRIVTITFHSLEDRIVKDLLIRNRSTTIQDESQKKWTALKKKVVIPQFEEINANFRSRSAKLRAATRT